ncbi:MAG: molecular chaperone HtpG [Proteobacteria bacterium]|nr:molecular chaperone HtpG [Pseudomonadota bacterium]
MTERAAGAEERAFEAEVGRILHIVANSLYSEREIFLRELVSNASDACDRLRYAALTEPGLTADDPDLKVKVRADGKARTLTVADNGIGMNHDELVADLGTIARSGTSAFVERLSGDAAKDVALIGQFGVGFYSSFMVADNVEVVSRKAGEAEAWRWQSDGKGTFTVAPAEGDAPRGTTVTLHLRKDAKEFLEPARLRRIIATYSDHIALPIVLDSEGKEETVNAAQALWTRPRKEITPDQYKEFYHHVGDVLDEPWLTIHNRVEGKIEYTNLIFVPSTRPFDLFHPDRKPHLRLYVKRVFITGDCEGLLPGYLRFVYGIVDSEDMPLNISREMLQKNPVVARIRSGLTKRVIGALERKAKKDADDYAAFWDNFGAVLKEGVYEDPGNRERLLELCRFRSTAGDRLVSLADYVERMKDGQDAIYTISGDAVETVSRSPQLEAFRARGVEVLLLTDPVDEFWIPEIGGYKEKPFRSVTRGGIDLSEIAEEKKQGEDEEPAPESAIDNLIALFRLTLKDAVKDVRESKRLTDSAVCLVADEGDIDMHLERLLKQHQRLTQTTSRVLELNPRHPLIKTLAGLVSEKGAAADLEDAAHLLLDQARIVEGETPPDHTAFARRLAAVMQKGLGA